MAVGSRLVERSKSSGEARVGDDPVDRMSTAGRQIGDIPQNALPGVCPLSFCDGSFAGKVNFFKVWGHTS
jgi:hypothetical protein